MFSLFVFGCIYFVRLFVRLLVSFCLVLFCFVLFCFVVFWFVCLLSYSIFFVSFRVVPFFSCFLQGASSGRDQGEDHRGEESRGAVPRLSAGEQARLRRAPGLLEGWPGGEHTPYTALSYYIVFYVPCTWYAGVATLKHTHPVHSTVYKVSHQAYKYEF